MCEVLWAEVYEQPFQALQTLVLLVTAGVVAYYTLETYRLRKAADAQLRTAQHQTKCQVDAHTFDAITRVHQLLSSPDAIRRRRWLFEYFEEDLRNALAEQGVAGGTTQDLNRALEARSRNLQNAKYYDPLANVEGVLADLNVLGISCRLGIEAARRVAEEYEPVIRNTAPLLLPFVREQRNRRGENGYKREYVTLLKSLGLLERNGLLGQYADMAAQD